MTAWRWGAVAALGAAGRLKQARCGGFDDRQARAAALKQGRCSARWTSAATGSPFDGLTAALDILSKKATPQDKELPVEPLNHGTDASAAGNHEAAGAVAGVAGRLIEYAGLAACRRA